MKTNRLSDSNTPVALVTGGAQGIGYGVSRRLAADGHRVWLLDSDDHAGRQAEAALTSQELDVHYVRADVTRENEIADLVRGIKADRGRLDVLVNNAGIADPFHGPVESLELAAWDRMIRTNLTGYFLCTKHCVPLLRQTRGAIVNIASSRAHQSEPYTEGYAAAKGGILALTHALAISLGPEIRVNAVSPGWIDVRAEQADASAKIPALRDIDHAQHPAGQVGRSADIAGIVAFLCSTDAAFVTGENIIADGGMTRKMLYMS